MTEFLKDKMNQNNDLNKLAKADIACSCGRRHRTDIKEIVIDNDLLPHLAGLYRRLLQKNEASERQVNEQGFELRTNKVLLIADSQTWKAAGARLYEQLNAAGWPVRMFCFPAGSPLVPDEIAVFNLINNMGPDISLLLAVGSGTINDLTRFVSHRSGTPYMIVATAPSMDGYASSVSALVANNMKQTVTAWGAEAILAEPSVLAASPPAMIAAGLGDILGKYTALCDWRLAGLIDNEYQCVYVADLVMEAVNACRLQAGKAARHDQEAVTGIFRTLILTGIAISYIGNSRPASGSEHHLSHFWEMALLRAGKPPVLHGSKVGLATIMTCALYRQLPELQPDFRMARERARQFSLDKWIGTMQRVYGAGAAEIIALEQTSGKHDPDQVCSRLQQIEAKWPDICTLVRQTIPDPGEIRQLLRQAGGPVDLAELGISRELAADSLRYAMEMRDRYTVLRLYADLGLCDMAVSIADGLYTAWQTDPNG